VSPKTPVLRKVPLSLYLLFVFFLGWFAYHLGTFLGTLFSDVWFHGPQFFELTSYGEGQLYLVIGLILLACTLCLERFALSHIPILRERLRWWQIFGYLFLAISVVGVIVALRARGDDRLGYFLVFVILPLFVCVFSFCCWVRLKVPSSMAYAPIIFGGIVIAVCVVLKSIYVPNTLIQQAKAELAKQDVVRSLGGAILTHYRNKPLPTTGEAPTALKKWGYKRISPERFILIKIFQTPRNLRMRLMKTFDEPDYWIQGGTKAVFSFEKRTPHTQTSKDVRYKP
jgi:hypothetical protein